MIHKKMVKYLVYSFFSVQMLKTEVKHVFVFVDDA